jgi:hypothetical protein
MKSKEKTKNKKVPLYKHILDFLLFKEILLERCDNKCE